MNVDHGRSHVRLSQQLLDRSDVVARFEHVGGKAMPKGMAAGRLEYSRLANRDLDGALQDFWVSIKADRPAGVRILAGRWRDP
jgi:hypothetical protein